MKLQSIPQKFDLPCPCGCGEIVEATDNGFDWTWVTVKACDRLAEQGIASSQMSKSLAFARNEAMCR